MCCLTSPSQVQRYDYPYKTAETPPATKSLHAASDYKRTAVKKFCVVKVTASFDHQNGQFNLLDIGL